MSKKVVVTLPNDMNAKLEYQAKQAGVSKLEYIRYLILKDTKGNNSN